MFEDDRKTKKKRLLREIEVCKECMYVEDL